MQQIEKGHNFNTKTITRQVAKHKEDVFITHSSQRDKSQNTKSTYF